MPDVHLHRRKSNKTNELFLKFALILKLTLFLNTTLYIELLMDDCFGNEKIVIVRGIKDSQIPATNYTLT